MGRKHHKRIKPEEFFYANSGLVIKNLKEFAFRIEKLSDEDYGHHVNAERNDFSTWVRDVIGDTRLAKDIAKAGDRRDMQIAALKRLVR